MKEIELDELTIEDLKKITIDINQLNQQANLMIAMYLRVNKIDPSEQYNLSPCGTKLVKADVDK